MEEVELEFLPQVAALVAEWFPELNNRVVAVTEAEITAANRPTLPFGMVALNREGSTTDTSRSNQEITISDDFIIEFWLKAERFDIDNRTSERPYWNYYPFEAIRDRLLTKIIKQSKRTGSKICGISYTSLDIDADPQAVVLTFRFSRSYVWCPLPDDDDVATPYVIGSSTCQADSCKEANT